MAVAKLSARKSNVSIPEHAHPMARAVFALMRQHAVTYDELEFKSGVLKSTIKAWRTDNRPGLDTIQAALGVFGYSVLAVPPPEVLPPELRADLEALAAKHGRDLPVVEFMANAVLRRPGNTIDARTRLSGPGERLAA